MKAPHFLQSIKSGLDKVAPWCIVVFLAAAMLFDPGRDTLGVASASFAVALALAAVSFSYARTLKDGSAARDDLVFAGERLIAGAVLFLFASIFKHGSMDIPRYVKTLYAALARPEPPQFAELIGLFVAFVAFMFFLLGLIYAQRGIGLLVSTAGRRAKRRPDHAIFFESNDSIQKRLAGLEREHAQGSEAPNGEVTTAVGDIA